MEKLSLEQSALEFAYESIGTSWHKEALDKKMVLQDYVDQEISELSRAYPKSAVLLVAIADSKTVYLLDKKKESDKLITQIQKELPDSEFSVEEFDTQELILLAMDFCIKNNILNNQI